MKKFRVIAPSWSELSADMQVETGSKYSAFIQLGGIPLYKHILRHYESIRSDTEFVFVLPVSAPELEYSLITGFDVSIIKIEESKSIGDTVLQAIEKSQPSQAILVHMADTLLSVPKIDQLDTIYIQLRTDLYRWTSIEKKENGQVRVLIDRDHRTAGFEQAVCVGVFTFSDGSYFQNQLSESTKFDSTAIDPFFKAVELYSNKYSVDLIEPDFWYDCGHVDSFYESRLNFHNLRHFNSLSYDPVKGLVTKRSKNSEDFRHQVRWFKQVPDEMAPFLPRIYESSDGESPYITMELLSIPTLSELFVNRRLELGAWNDVANKILYIQSLLSKYAFKSKINQNIAYQIYMEKTNGRILEYIKQHPVAVDIWILVSGRRMSLSKVLLTLDSYVDQSGLLTPDALTPIHGDMCFSNLLYDARGRNIKLIDPRGEFGIPGIYGDPRYDNAKLMHSYAGGYDLIVSDHFEVAVDSSGLLRCTVQMTDYHHKVRQILDAVLFKEDKGRRQCDAVQALLFLSMLPLHCDKPKRQLAMLYIGLNLYAKNLMDGKYI